MLIAPDEYKDDWERWGYDSGVLDAQVLKTFNPTVQGTEFMRGYRRAWKEAFELGIVDVKQGREYGI